MNFLGNLQYVLLASVGGYLILRGGTNLTIGSIQAMEAVKYITGNGELLCGKILSFDGLTMKVRVHSMPGFDHECAVCGNNPSIHSLAENRDDYTLQSCRTGGEQ